MKRKQAVSKNSPQKVRRLASLGTTGGDGEEGFFRARPSPLTIATAPVALPAKSPSFLLVPLRSLFRPCPNKVYHRPAQALRRAISAADATEEEEMSANNWTTRVIRRTMRGPEGKDGAQEASAAKSIPRPLSALVGITTTHDAGETGLPLVRLLSCSLARFPLELGTRSHCLLFR